MVFFSFALSWKPHCVLSALIFQFFYLALQRIDLFPAGKLLLCKPFGPFQTQTSFKSWNIYSKQNGIREQIKLSAFWAIIESFRILYDIFPACLGDSSTYGTGVAHILKISFTLVTSFSCPSCWWRACYSVFRPLFSLISVAEKWLQQLSCLCICTLKGNQNR